MEKVSVSAAVPRVQACSMGNVSNVYLVASASVPLGNCDADLVAMAHSLRSTAAHNASHARLSVGIQRQFHTSGVLRHVHQTADRHNLVAYAKTGLVELVAPIRSQSARSASQGSWVTAMEHAHVSEGHS